MRGGAAVQYGPNNVGGVINFISKPIPKKWENNLGERITFSPAGRQLYDTYLSTGGHVTDNLGLFFDRISKFPRIINVGEITIKANFHHTPRHIREALDAIHRGKIKAQTLITGEEHLAAAVNDYHRRERRFGTIPVPAVTARVYLVSD